MECVAKKSSPLQSRIIRKPFNACKKGRLEIDSLISDCGSLPAGTSLHSTVDCRKSQSPACSDCPGSPPLSPAAVRLREEDKYFITIRAELSSKAGLRLPAWMYILLREGAR